ncbi:hypothetical protein [Tautonia plasticadhaerens]|uniref:Uncharacterized protein n=1 Tax=Tautonia plasticadhaerens TaxID=2527974 RepID=A0A518HFA0_9BACT|nr:hypothetical protein [Tautonia plasticadhaerens]QDV39524.1 hypothetical protein ElP_74930 [Tautonia plasticadhaerens]
MANGFGGLGGGGGIAVVGAGASLVVEGGQFIDSEARGGDGGAGADLANGIGGQGAGGAIRVFGDFGEASLEVEGTRSSTAGPSAATASTAAR